MPPKKQAAAASKEEEKEHVIPTNKCNFNIEFECKHEAGHYLKVKFDWMKIEVGEQTQITFPVTDTGHLKDWTLVQIEGEDPVTQDDVDPKAKAAAAKKGADPKKAASKLEEITDNRPRTVKYEYDVTEMNNGVSMEITEEIAQAFQTSFMKIEVFDVNKETLEESLLDTISLDISCLLFPADKVDVSIDKF